MLFAFIVLALAVTTQETSARHVRATDPKVQTLIDAGTFGSPTFRGLIGILNESDVIVYIQPKLTRQALGGYLAHNIVAGVNSVISVSPSRLRVRNVASSRSLLTNSSTPSKSRTHQARVIQRAWSGCSVGSPSRSPAAAPVASKRRPPRI